MGKCGTLTMVARVGGAAVRRSARLIAATASENTNSPHPRLEKIGGTISVAKPSSKVPRTKSRSKTKAVKEDDDGYKKTPDLVVEAAFVSETKDVPPKELRRTKCLKRFPSRDLEVQYTANLIR